MIRLKATSKLMVILTSSLLCGGSALAQGTSNDMIRGGCQSTQECVEKVQSSDLKASFRDKGITPESLRAGDANVKNGIVTKSGSVIIKDKNGQYTKVVA